MKTRFIRKQQIKATVTGSQLLPSQNKTFFKNAWFDPDTVIARKC